MAHPQTWLWIIAKELGFIGGVCPPPTHPLTPPIPAPTPAQFIAKELGFIGGVCPNSMDAVSDREFTPRHRLYCFPCIG